MEPRPLHDLSLFSSSDPVCGGRTYHTIGIRPHQVEVCGRESQFRDVVDNQPPIWSKFKKIGVRHRLIRKPDVIVMAVLNWWRCRYLELYVITQLVL